MLGSELTAEQPEGLANVAELFREIRGGKPVELGPALETEFHRDAALVLEPVALAQRLGNDEDV